MRAVGGEQELELAVLEVPVDRRPQGNSLVQPQAVGHLAAKVSQQPDQVEHPHFREESVEPRGFGRKHLLQLSQIPVEIRRDGVAASIRKMKVIHRIHLDPFGFHFEPFEQSAGDRFSIAEQRIKMAGGVEPEALPRKRAAIPPDYIVLLGQEHLETRLREEIGAGQPAKARPNDDRIVLRRWIFVDAETADGYVARLAADLASGEWDRRFGMLRTQPEFDGSLRLIVARQARASGGCPVSTGLTPL